jgi:hypothetical protein
MKLKKKKRILNSFTSFNFVRNLHYFIGITRSLKQVKLALIVIPLSQKIFMTFDSLKRLYENCQLKIVYFQGWKKPTEILRKQK